MRSQSHQKALAAQAAGNFDGEIVPVPVTFTTPDAKSKPKRRRSDFKVDEGPRADTSFEALAKLKAAFHAKGTVTAGNSSQTSDGAAAAVVMSDERAKALGLAAARAIRRVCLCRMPARGDGHRAGVCDSEGAETRRA